MDVPFNRAAVPSAQPQYVAESFASGHISGDGPFSSRAADLLSAATGSPGVLLTPSCTDALEMAALLLELQPGDEVIVPAYTFVSTANSFAMFGARPLFADVRRDDLNIDPESVGELLSPRTKAIVPVHYGGVACDMDRIIALAARADAAVVEDNAHGLFGRDAGGRTLGSVGDLATLSFHETKNISCGEGGALLLNDPALIERAEILREKGTNRTRFFRGEVDRYTWVDLGSSYLLADPLAAVLVAQLEDADAIQGRRRIASERYAAELADWADAMGVQLGLPDPSCSHPFHLFWMLMPDLATRTRFIAHMRTQGVHAVFHYQALNASPMGTRFGARRGQCPVAEDVTDRLVRLPVFSDIRSGEVDRVIEVARSFS